VKGFIGGGFHTHKAWSNEGSVLCSTGYALEVIGFPANHLFKGFSHDFQALTIKVGFLLSG
jgi:hypothetical protein